MPKKIPPAPERPTVEVEATAYFKHDGEQIRPGVSLKVEAIDADDLVALRFARRTER